MRFEVEEVWVHGARDLGAHQWLRAADWEAERQDVWPLAPRVLCTGKVRHTAREEQRLGVWVRVCEVCEQTATFAGTAAEVVTRLDARVPNWRNEAHGEVDDPEAAARPEPRRARGPGPADGAAAGT